MLVLQLHGTATPRVRPSCTQSPDAAIPRYAAGLWLQWTADYILKETDDILQETDDILKEAEDILQETDDILKEAEDILQETDDIFKKQMTFWRNRWHF